MKPPTLDGCRYDKAEIDNLRTDLMVYRDRAFAAFPEGIQMTMVLSHAIGLLALFRDEVDT